MDNLFSAAELGAKATLLGSMGEPPEKFTHRTIHKRFNRHAAPGTAYNEHRSAFNRLAAARPAFRYLQGEAKYGIEEVTAWLVEVQRFLEFVRQQHLTDSSPSSTPPTASPVPPRDP